MIRAKAHLPFLRAAFRYFRHLNALVGKLFLVLLIAHFYEKSIRRRFAAYGRLRIWHVLVLLKNAHFTRAYKCAQLITARARKSTRRARAC